jgi:hypothetical protein
MAIATESFESILVQAKVGELQLPEFQRDYVWVRAQVIELFDSLRQRYPIGSFLFMERNPEVALVPRPFEGTEKTLAQTQPDLYALDGQQRITSGLALFHGLGPSQYYVNLQKLWALAQAQGVNYSDSGSVRRFLADLDNDDDYCVGRNRRANPLDLLESHLLHTAVLSDSFSTSAALKSYVALYPDREEFVNGVVREPFRLGADVQIPVTRVETNRPVEAISRIFATLNTTGRPLTPFELVVALLYPSGIRLKSDIDENRQIFPHYNNMDKTGEVFLQTIALLADESPKKSHLPKTIKPDRYQSYRNEAVDILEKLGVFLTTRLGVALDQTNALIPYDSIFSPMALALKHLEAMGLKAADKAQAERKLQKWFIAAPLANRYQEGVHTKQSRDLHDSILWLSQPGDDAQPQWISELRIPRLTSDTPEGAIGRLLRCLINRRHPTDPVSGHPVGYHASAVVSSKHHIWPTRFCNKYLKGWTKSDSCDLALNITMVSQSTNILWVNSDPANQLQEIFEAQSTTASAMEMLRGHFLDQTCVDINEALGQDQR